MVKLIVEGNLFDENKCLTENTYGLRAKCSCKDKEYPLTEVFSFLSLERNWREIYFLLSVLLGI